MKFLWGVCRSRPRRGKKLRRFRLTLSLYIYLSKVCQKATLLVMQKLTKEPLTKPDTLDEQYVGAGHSTLATFLLLHRLMAFGLLSENFLNPLCCDDLLNHSGTLEGH